MQVEAHTIKQMQVEAHTIIQNLTSGTAENLTQLHGLITMTQLQWLMQHGLITITGPGMLLSGHHVACII